MKPWVITVIIIVSLFTLCFAGRVKAEDLHVPEQYANISEAIKNAFPGDNIVIATGTYDEQIVLDTGANIIGAGTDKTIITSSNSPIIDVPIAGSLIIQGVTIDGKGAKVTGISLIDYSLASIKDVVITNVGEEGIVCPHESAPNISNVVITNTGSVGISCTWYCRAKITNVNIANTGGDGIYCDASPPNITNVIITNVGGNGVYCHKDSSPTLNNCIIKRAKANGILIGNENNGGQETSAPKIRRCLISENRMDGVQTLRTEGSPLGSPYKPNPNLGLNDDPGGNEIYNNGNFAVNNPISHVSINAIGNWWGQQNPPAQLFNGNVTIKPALTEPSLSKLPTITGISPRAGSIEGDTLVKITGSQFAEGAIVEIGGKEATNITVDSDTQITAVTPAGNFGLQDVVVINPDGNSGTLPASFAYVPTESEGMREFELSLTKGVNLISLPLRPDNIYTASTLASELSATVILRSHEGDFQVYVPEGGYGLDFPIEAGKGYIVNVLKETKFSLTGIAWGTPVPAAPSTPVTGTWAFVVAGSVSGGVPQSATILITNYRTGQTTTARIDASSKLTAAFVDMSKRDVVAAGDEISFQVLDHHSNPIGGPTRQRITNIDLAGAYLLSTVSTRSAESLLLPNYPNPFNPDTWIPYQLSHDCAVSIRIYNINGWLIHTLALGQRAAGHYLSRDEAAYWDGKDVAGEDVSSGIYFYQLTAGDFSAVRRMVVLK